ncbi:MAG: hypothetical protein WA784_11700 [Albidovulum sp.]
MSISVQQMADRVAELMEARLRIKGDSLNAKLRRGRRFLPRRVLTGAQYLAQSAEQAQVPRLQSQLDPEQIALAYDTCVRYLKPLGSGARRRAFLLQFATSLALTLLVTTGLLIGVLIWRGYI